MDYINLYKGPITNAGINGTVVTDSNKIITTVKTTGEEKYQVIALRCEDGYKTEGDTVLELTGETKNAWAFEYNGSKGEYGAPLTISDSIGNRNVAFKLYSKALEDEEPCVKKDVVITVKTSIATA